MATLKLNAFSGEIPRLIPSLLPEGFAQSAFNARLTDGALTPVRNSGLIVTLPTDTFPTGIKTIHEHNDEWLAWDKHVYVVQGAVAADRLYIFGDGKPKVRQGGQNYDLAVPRPDTGLSFSISGTATNQDVYSRLYAYTLVTNLGEESEPSPLTAQIDWRAGQNVTLSGFIDHVQGRAIEKQRIYRSQSGTAGGTDLYLIAERDVTTANFVDNIPVDAIMERLPSRDWNAPPDNLTGGIQLPNGMMAAFEGKNLYFCEPWRPHAWPEKYVLTTDYDIVGLGAYGTSVVVVTKGNPYIVSGTTPEGMYMEKLELNLPCINARGIQDLGYSVVYPSHEGLVVISNGSAQVTSTSLISRDMWQSMKPETMVSGQFNQRYYSTYSYLDERDELQAGTLIFDFTGEQPFIIRSNIRPTAYYYDIVKGKLYYLNERTVLEYESQSEVNSTLFWKSKEYILPKPVNFGAIKVDAQSFLSDQEIAVLEKEIERISAINRGILQSAKTLSRINNTRLGRMRLNGDTLLKTPKLNRNVTVSVYADKQLVATVTNFNEMVRLPSGFLADKWEVSVSSDMTVTQIAIASTAIELMNV